MGSPLQEKSKVFALKIIRVCNEIKQSKRETVLTNRLAAQFRKDSGHKGHGFSHILNCHGWYILLSL